MVMTSALSPALSPRRGRIIRRLLVNQVTEICSAAYELMRADRRCPLSPRERVGVRAGVLSLRRIVRASLRRLLQKKNESVLDKPGNLGDRPRPRAAAGGFVAAGGAQALPWLRG